MRHHRINYKKEFKKKKKAELRRLIFIIAGHTIAAATAIFARDPVKYAAHCFQIATTRIQFDAVLGQPFKRLKGRKMLVKGAA